MGDMGMRSPRVYRCNFRFSSLYLPTQGRGNNDHGLRLRAEEIGAPHSLT